MGSGGGVPKVLLETIECFMVNIPNPKNTGCGAIPTFFGYHHIQLCGVSLSTVWGVCEAIWHATPKS
jgi:hypothetical protein